MSTKEITVNIIGTEYFAEERLRSRTLQLDSLMMFITQGTEAFNGLDDADREYVMELVRDVAWEMRHLSELIHDSKPRPTA